MGRVQAPVLGGQAARPAPPGDYLSLLEQMREFRKLPLLAVACSSFPWAWEEFCALELRLWRLRVEQEEPGVPGASALRAPWDVFLFFLSFLPGL